MPRTFHIARPGRLLKAALIGAMLPVVLVLSVQIPSVRTAVVNRALRAYGPWQDMELRTRGTAGSVLWSLGLTDLTLTRADGSVAIRVDSVGVAWSPSALFRRRLDLDEVVVRSPVVTARRDSAGVIDLAVPFTETPDEPSPWTVRIDRLDVFDGLTRIETEPAGTWAAGGIRVALSGLSTGDDFRLRLDTLRADIADPQSTFPGRLDLRATVSDGAAVVDTMAFRTSRSLVTGSGGLRLPGLDTPTTDSLRFRFDANPLALGDLSPLFPALRSEGELRIAVDARGNGRRLDVRAEAETDDSGRLAIDLSTLIGADTVVWTGSFTADRLSSSKLLADRPVDEQFSGAGALDLSGPDLERLSGAARVDLSASHLAGFDDLSISVDQVWQDGRAATRIALQADGSEVHAEGWIEALAAVPAYAFEIRTSELARDRPIPVRGMLEATLRGSGLDLRGEADLSWRLREAKIGGCPVGGDGGLLALREGRIDVALRLEPCDAPVRLEADLDLAGRRPWTIRSLEFDDVPLAPRDTVAGHLTALVTGSGFLDPLGLPSGALRLTGGRIDWSGFRVDSVSASATVLGTDWNLDLDGTVADGSVRVRASGDDSAARIQEIAFRGVDASRLRGGGLPPSSLTGRASASLDWSDPAAIAGTLDATLGASRFAAQDIDSMRVEIDIKSGRGALTASAGLHGGLFGMEAAFGVEPDSTWFRLLGARFEGIDVAAWTGSAIDTDLAGSARGAFASGPDGATGDLVLTLDDGSRVRGGRLETADLELRLRPDSTVAVLEARFEGGGLLGGRFRLMADSTYLASLVADSLDAARLAGVDTAASRVSGSVQARGRGFDTRTAEFLLEVNLGGRFGPVEIDRLNGIVRLADGIVAVETFQSAGSFGSLDAVGTLPLPGGRFREPTELRATVDLRDVSGLARASGLEDFAAVAGDARLRIRGSERGLAVSATTEIGGLMVRRVHVATISGTLSAEVDPEWMLRAAEVRLEANTLSLPSTTAEEANVLATIRGDTVAVDADIRFTDRRQARGSAVLTDSLRHVTILSFEARLDDADWALLSPTDIELADGFRLSGAVLQAGDQRIAAGGGLGAEDGNLYVTAENVRLDAVASLLGFRGLGMVVGGALTGTGSADRPQLNGVVEAGITVGGRPSANLTLATALAEQVLQIDARIENASGGSATVQGNVSLEGERIVDAPVNLDIDADSLAVAWMLPFLDRDLVSDLGGRVTGRVEVRGTFEVPDVTGRATLRRGRIGLPTLGRPRQPLKYSDIEADLAFEEATVTVERASMRSGPGTMRASGFVELERLTLGRFALDITSADFLAIDDAAYSAYAASDLRLSGTTRAPHLSGSVRVTRGTFFMTDEKAADALEPVELDATDLLVLEQRFGIRITEADTSQVTFYDLLTIENLRLDFQRDTWFRSRSNPKMDVRFTGSLDVQKAPRAEPLVFGTIQVVPEQSRIEQFGRRFDIERGELSFSGPMSAPEIDIAATYEVRSKGTTREEVTIRLVASGRPENLRIDFESDPAMDLSDIISYIATGRPASSSLQFEGSGDGYLNTAAGLAIGPIAGIVEDVAGAGLGLDVVEIEHDGLNGLTLTAGKYVSPELYVAVRQPISFASGTEASSTEESSQTQVSMEYEVLRELMVSLLSRGAILRIQLRWEHAF